MVYIYKYNVIINSKPQMFGPWLINKGGKYLIVIPSTLSTEIPRNYYIWWLKILKSKIKLDLNDLGNNTQEENEDRECLFFFFKELNFLFYFKLIFYIFILFGCVNIKNKFLK
jgi:hypothetical protein